MGAAGCSSCLYLVHALRCVHGRVVRGKVCLRVGRPCNKIYCNFVHRDSCPGCEQDAAYGGWDGARTNAEGILHSHDGKLWINLPGQTTLVFKQEV